MSFIKDKLNKFTFPAWSAPLALLGVCGCAYGLLIPELGFYWDDWETILVTKLYPLSEFWAYFAGTRPLAAWTHILFGAIVGVRPLAWHILTLLLRWATVWGMYWAFGLAWPKQRRLAFYAALLFAVYPLFIQQPISVAYHQHWTSYALFFFSLGAMLLYARRVRHAWLWQGAGVLALFLNLAIMEYFMGVEMLRLLLLWFVFRDEASRRRRLVKVLRTWLPYLLVLAGFVAWRMIYSLNDTADPNRPGLLFDLLNNPLSVLSAFLQMGLQDTLSIIVSVWQKAFDPLTINLHQPFLLLSWGVSLLVALGLGIYLWRLQEASPVESEKPVGSDAAEFALVGLLAIPLGSLPVWVTGRQFTGGAAHTDRFGLVAMFGAAMLLAAALTWLVGDKNRQALLVCILVGAGCGVHLRVANDYRWSWEVQQRIYWELFWRAPEIKPTTVFLSEADLFSYTRPAFAFNLLYGRPEKPENLAYEFVLLRSLNLNELESGIEIKGEHRQFKFSGNTSNGLVLYYNPPDTNCLWVLRKEDVDNAALSEGTRSIAWASNLERIGKEVQRADIPFTDVYGKEPARNWCAIFEEAELKRQYGDWDAVVRLADEAVAAGYTPKKAGSDSPREWLPMIEAYIHAGRLDEAAGLSRAALERDGRFRGMVCAVWGEGIAPATLEKAGCR